MMCAKSKTWFVSLPALLLFMTATVWVLSEDAAATVISCNESTCGCDDKASCDKMKKGNWCKKGTIECDDKGADCGCTAAKLAAPPTKVQPKVQPGGAETPGTESPNVQPKSGVKRY